MNNEFYIYFYLFLIFLLLFTSVFILFRLLKTRKETNSKVKAVQYKFEKKIKELEGELRRQNFVIADYQEKLFNKKNAVTEQNTDNSFSNTDQDISEIISEKNQLEKEKLQFKDKTKKLWEQSLAIHKEKERIEGLKKQIERDHQHLTDSVKYAKYIQNALLPPESYLNEILPDYFILFKPKDIVSGDFYWMKQIDNYLIVVAADCTGHGVPGAFMSMLGISSLNEIILQINEFNPAEILEKLRTTVINSLHQTNDTQSSKDGMDAAICIYDKEKSQLQYAGANNPMLLIRNYILTEYKPTKSPVSYYMKMRDFENNIIDIQKNDFIYIFSDGFNDQFGGEKGMKFKSRNFKSLLVNLSTPEANMKDIKSKVFETFENWKTDKYLQIDDVLIVGIRF